MKPEEFYLDADIESFEYINKNDIKILDIITIDKRLIHKFYIIINRYFKNRLDLIKIFYDFNDITSPDSIFIGKKIKIPDIDSLESQLLTNKIFEDDIIPGVNTTMDNNRQEITKSIKIALPKLNITQKPVDYNSETGRLTF